MLWNGNHFLKLNKKSAESDVAPAGIKSICIEKNLFCSIQEIDGL